MQQLELPENLARYQDREALKQATLPELEALCQALRTAILSITGQNGGHLGANLGVVELTVALLRQFDFRQDRLIWDVGHQCYAYKILTDRLDQMKTLRQAGGLSGFPKREESPYDAFNTGHSSTALSAALGLARAAKRLGRIQQTVAVIGDGAMTGGLVWEALNNLQPDDDVLVILNDNGMSISPNVGLLSGHLKSIRINPSYLKAKPRVEQALAKLPGLGDWLIQMGSRLKRKTRKAIQPPNSIFENLGIRYYGPIDGHDLEQLQKYLAALAQVKGPRLLHLITTKGRGYAPAENQPESYHGVSPHFHQQALEGKRASAADVVQGRAGLLVPKDFTEAFAQTMLRLAQEQPNLVGITAAMPTGTGLDLLARQMPDRVQDVGIAEAHALTYAAGLAVGGLKPVVALYSTFYQRAYDQWVHDCCLQALPVTLCLDRAGFVGADGETHQGLYDLATSLVLPEVRIFAPATYAELAQALEWATQATKGPWLIRYPKGKMPADAQADPLWNTCDELTGRVDPLCLEEGQDATVIAVGPMRGPAREACRRLKQAGYHVQLIAPGSLKPLPIEAYRALILPHKPLVILEEGSQIGGWGQYLIDQLKPEGPYLTIGIPDEPMNQATVEESRRAVGLSGEALAQTVQSLIETDQAGSTR